jgi:hypothetical protein
MNKSLKTTAIAFLVAAIVAPSIASALATRTWTQRGGYGATNDFNDSRNWEPSVVPGASENVVYNGNVSNVMSVISSNATVADITIESSYSSTIAFSGGAKLTVMGGAAGFTNNSTSATVSLSSGTLDLRSATKFVNKGVIQESGSAKILFNASELGVTDSVGLPIGEVDLGGEFFIRVIDLDENLNGNAIDTTTVIVNNLINGDQESITLFETDKATGEFTNLGNGFQTEELAVPGMGNGKLEGEAGDTLQIVYMDDEDASDGIEVISSFHTDCNANAVAGAQNLDCNNNLVSDACEFSRGCPGIVLGDMNCDSGVDGGDMQGFIGSYVSNSYTCQADMNQDGTLSQVDALSFVDTLLRP